MTGGFTGRPRAAAAGAAALLATAAVVWARPVAAATLGPEGVPPHPVVAQRVAGVVLMLAVVALALLLSRGAWRGVAPRLGRPPRWELLALLALTVGGFLLRVLVATPTPLLSSFNDVRHAHDAMCVAGLAGNCDLSWSYPFGVTAVQALVLGVVGPSVTATYWTNAALSALTIPVAWGLGVLLFGGRRRAGWWVAGALAALPLHVRFAATGAHTTGLAFFAALSLAAFLLAAETRRPRHLWIAGLAAALAVQSRFEGFSFLLVLLFAALFVARGAGRTLFARRLRAHTIAAAALVALAAAPVLLTLLEPWEFGDPRGRGVIVRNLAAAVGAPLLLVGVGAALDRLRAPAAARWLVGLAAVGLALLALGQSNAPWIHAALGGPAVVPANPGSGLATWADEGIPALNAWNLPAPLFVLLALAVPGALLRGRDGRSRAAPAAALFLWLGLVTALGVTKHTGSLPFEGFRTAVSGSVALAGLVALGALALVGLVDRLGARLGSGRAALRAAAVAAVALAIAAGPALSWPMLRDGGYDNERQLRFLERHLPTVPGPALVIVPADPPDAPVDERFAHSFRIAETWWTVGRAAGRQGDRFLGSPAALAEPDVVREALAQGTPVLFWEPLTCFRQRGPAQRRRAACQAIHDAFRLAPVAHETFPNRPFDSDHWTRLLIPGATVTVTIYRVTGAPQGRAAPALR